MRSNIDVASRDRFTNDILLSIFDRISIVHRIRLSRVCRRWKELIDITFQWVSVFSAVDDRRCVADWKPSNWLGLKFVSQDDYIRIPKVSASEMLSRVAIYLPNLTAIDLECCDMNNRIIRTILNSCKRIERINLDSSIRLNFYSFKLMAQDWTRLKHINLSCCTEVNEISARLLIERLTRLESLNLCGTKISGLCLGKLNENLKRLDISYCWGVQQEGLMALAGAKCKYLEELSVNNFDFNESESCIIALCNSFFRIRHLQLSIGPCVTHDYFIDRLTGRGFTAISKLKDLDTLIIEKICIMNNEALLSIIRNCKKLRCIRLNLGWLNYCNDIAFASIDSLIPNLEELHISFPSSLTCAGLCGLPNMKRLKALSLINTDIDNGIFNLIEGLDNLISMNFDDCRKINTKGLNQLIKIASRRCESQTITASLLGTGISLSRLKYRKKFPPNLTALISEYRAPKSVMQLPPPVMDM